jgi:ribosome-binding protein aMBF1 (putative translation factor)
MSYTQSMTARKPAKRRRPPKPAKQRAAPFAEPPKDAPHTLATFVKRVRASRELTQRALAEQIGTFGPYVAMIEDGKREYPTDFIRKLKPILTMSERQEVLEILVNSLKEECGL